LPVEKEMKQRSAKRKNPNPTAQRRVLGFFREFRRRRDYCTFFAGAASAEPTMIAVIV
jgi:hypothetical protein